MDRERLAILATCSSAERAIWVALFREVFPAALRTPEPEWHRPPRSPGSTLPRLTDEERLDRMRVRQVDKRRRRRERNRQAMEAA